MTAVVIIGFGLIGGSIAAALRQRGRAKRIVAVDLPSVISGDAGCELSDQRVSIDATSELESVLRECDLAVLAAPVSVIQAELPLALDAAPLVTDCGSTKRAIVGGARAHARVGRFVPGHPLAGGSRGGVVAARADLFDGRQWILCPEHADPDAVGQVREFIESLGARTLSMSAAEHDRAVAMTSHVPQLLASALVSLSEQRGARGAEGPGFASSTRVAGGNPAVWRDIFRTNADEVALALRELGTTLAEVARDLERDPPDVSSATALLEAARSIRGGE